MLKPFNLEKALAGEKVVIGNGEDLEVTNILTNLYPKIVVLFQEVRRQKREYAKIYGLDGQLIHLIHPYSHAAYRLYMADDAPEPSKITEGEIWEDNKGSLYVIDCVLGTNIYARGICESGSSRQQILISHPWDGASSRYFTRKIANSIKELIC